MNNDNITDIEIDPAQRPRVPRLRAGARGPIRAG